MSRKSRDYGPVGSKDGSLPYLRQFNHIPAQCPKRQGRNMEQDRNLLIQAEMRALLEGITPSLVEEHPVQFLLHLDQIRQKAEQHRLTAVRDLSCAFESALQQAFQHGRGTITAQAYLESMKDALSCEPSDHRMTEAVMASVALRLGGQP